ncbi:hypothetical protein CN300_19800 [Bacillus thuringiensis]|uniref:hypothetical protein n=1 Tax=Bacillus cereus group TaxID=86661 RepID=UPI000BF9E3CD|nr:MULTISPECIES: hypothetical protein [Bacillus cereus group]NKX59817.1 hypothetical protein [Bacillus cereus]PEY71201.1 hypothetical protein CN355_20930 [Bacillus thuringiensis]PFC43019.1 hypothetical protein CN300_19800 [Bacillus thuringiensis]PGV62796.1 hypothetical protein COD96_28040 [Bacillus thuringiensis]PGW48579.1 hypothetical protein COE14_27025 [Bacillus thuringiensis]
MDGVYEQKAESKSVIELLSKFSTVELIEALKVKQDVQVNDTTEETWAIKYDLTKVKKYCLLINNCNPAYIESYKRILEVEQRIYAGGCCD